MKSSRAKQLDAARYTVAYLFFRGIDAAGRLGGVQMRGSAIIGARRDD